MKIKTSKWLTSKRANYVIYILGFTIIGLITLYVANASTVLNNAIEPENDVIAGSSIVGADTNASGGKYVTFRTAQPQVTGSFYIVGKDIVGPDGKIFVPFGGNVSMLMKRSWGLERSWVFDFGGSANDHSDQAIAWGWNTIRVNVVCDRSSDGYATPRELADSIAEIVKEYTAKKIVVTPECHDDTGTKLAFTGTGIDPRMAKVEEFWNYVMAENGKNPYVWFNIVNEPTDGTDAMNISYWTSLNNYYMQKRNAFGSNNIIVADLPNWGQGIDALANQSFGTTLSLSSCNVLYSWHAYGGLRGDVGSNYETWLQSVQAKNLPVIIGEYGFRIDGQDFVPGNASVASGQELIQATDKVLMWNTTKNIGSTVWHGTGDSGGKIIYSLLSDYTTYGAPGFFNSINGSGLSPLGQKVWAAGHAQPVRAVFSGNISSSHCTQ